MSVAYSIAFINNANQAGTVCLYQQNPGQMDPNIWPLAWITKRTEPGEMVTFSFTIDFSFFWAQTGSLVPGVSVYPNQMVPADLYSNNSIDLMAHTPHDLQFGYPRSGPQPGSLYIQCAGNVPMNMVTVGIGMSGAGTFAIQGQPNTNNVFTPHPTYWVTFGDYFYPNTIIDLSTISNTVEVAFPANA